MSSSFLIYPIKVCRYPLPKVLIEVVDFKRAYRQIDKSGGRAARATHFRRDGFAGIGAGASNVLQNLDGGARA